LAYAWNQVTSITSVAFLAFPLSTIACGLPAIEFDIFNPVMRWAREIERSEAFSISTNTVLNCSKSLNNTKQWNILQCNTDTEKCSSTTYLNKLVSQLSSAQTSEIYIQSQQLPLGTYLFNFTVSMNTQTNFAASAYTYITIIASAIQVNMLANGTSMITSGVTQSILLEPGVYSIDPDSNYFNSNVRIKSIEIKIKNDLIFILELDL
jgi:predicted phage tail protein